MVDSELAHVLDSLKHFQKSIALSTAERGLKVGKEAEKFSDL